MYSSNKLCFFNLVLNLDYLAYSYVIATSLLQVSVIILLNIYSFICLYSKEEEWNLLDQYAFISNPSHIFVMREE